MIKQLTDREHVTARPAMYIGAVNLTKSHEYIFYNNKMEYKEIQYVPGFIKIINEIIDNCVDVAIKTNFKSSNLINIKITSECVEISDNGTGIPIKTDGTQQYAQLAWGCARAGSNFEDDENRIQIGMNGVGSFSTNCFSTKFIGCTDDGKNKYTITFKDNAKSFTDKLEKSSGSTGVTVKFYPDLAKFGLTEIDEVHMNIIKQRLINLSMSFPEITFKFNARKIGTNTFKKYVQLFNKDAEIYETDNYKFAILPNDADDFRQFSYVNGLKIPDGGTHIDIITNSIVSILRERLTKKYKTIKPGDIKNKLMVIAFLKNVKNTKFNSQSKEKITNSTAELNKYFGDIPFDKIALKLFKNPAIIDPITEVYRIKEEFKRRQELKGLNKSTKKIRSDKYLPSIGTKKYLLLVEGQCLSEDTPILMSDYSYKLIKDVNVGDELISGDLSKTQVLAKTKLLKNTLTFRTNSGTFTCGMKHKMKVLNVETNQFEFVVANVIAQYPEKYKFIKSKINSDSRGLKVLVNNPDKSLMLQDGMIFYTDDDFFVILRNSEIIRVHGTEIMPHDIVITA